MISSSHPTFRPIKPGFIRPGNLVELQIGICAISIGRSRFAFVPKLRAICVLSREVEKVCHWITGRKELSYLRQLREPRTFNKQDSCVCKLCPLLSDWNGELVMIPKQMLQMQKYGLPVWGSRNDGCRWCNTLPCVKYRQLQKRLCNMIYMKETLCGWTSQLNIQMQEQKTGEGGATTEASRRMNCPRNATAQIGI